KKLSKKHTLSITTDYYFDVHNRDSIDNNGKPLLSVVHFLQGYDNAFWNGSLMVYGDGDEDLPKTQRIFNRFTLLDICAHELSHAVNQYEANLVYQDQSGALSESFSDVFAVLVTQKKLNQTAEQADWLIAKDLFTNNVNATALRSMKNPGSAYDDPLIGKDPQLGHMNDYNNTTSDYGGVHINSGIPNKAFYECAIRIGGPAWNNPADIWYKTWTEKLGPNSTFQNCADFTYTAAEELFGKNSNSHKAVKDGWAAVGINVSEKKGCNIFARIAQIFK
ncbi:MAG: M4 family metallopeptidase, partial [Candidatus Heimdallarchaeota archaeon]